jgi:hypothetical protein
MFMVDDRYQILRPTSQFFAAQLLTEEWSQPKDAEHLLYKAASDVKDPEGHVLVTAYALHRPDGQWSLMLVNKDYEHAHSVRIVFHDSDASRDASFTGKVTMITFGKEQYQFHPNRKKGYADPDGPPKTRMLQAGEDTSYALPAASVTVLRGVLGTPSH